MNHHSINPLNGELNPICHLLTLLGAHHILHVSRIGVNTVLHQYTTPAAAAFYVSVRFFLFLRSFVVVYLRTSTAEGIINNDFQSIFG